MSGEVDELKGEEVQGGESTREGVFEKKDYVTFGTALRVVVAVSLLASSLCVFVYDRVFATKVRVFDMNGFLMQIRQDAVSGKLSDEQYQERFAKLEAVLKGVPSNTVIISGDVALGENWKKLETGDLPIASENLFAKKRQ